MHQVLFCMSLRKKQGYAQYGSQACYAITLKQHITDKAQQDWNWSALALWTGLSL